MATTLDQLVVGQCAHIVEVGGERAQRQHFLDMGMIPEAHVKLIKYAPLGDPMEILIQGYSLTLRKADAMLITVEPCEEENDTKQTHHSASNLPYMVSLHDHYSHPGIGEAGKYHKHETENPLPKGTLLTIALVGQLNTGKTTLFNLLTGAKEHVSNFPGTTVETCNGAIKGYPDTLVTDLPGIYSLSASNEEENKTYDFILNEKPKAIINVVDANNIERNLYLTLQLIELGIPMVLALNMMDEVHNNGGSIRVNEMEKILGIPVVPISATKKEGVSELMEHVIHVARYQEGPAKHDFYGEGKRFGKEGWEEEVAKRRFDFIRRLCGYTVVKPVESKEYLRSRRIDKILTGKYTAIPIFMIVMMLIIWLSIDVLGLPAQEWLAQKIQWFSDACSRIMIRHEVNAAVQSLVINGIFRGVGSVLSFVPIIILLFFFLSLLEDSGYMARVAFVSDKFLRKLGLTGHSIVPLLLGFGCSVPAVMATRTLPSSRDRRRTILLTPFMSCSAKIPIYAFFTSTFFPHHGGLVLICLYLLGITLGIITALVTKWFKREYDTAPFVMELPNYRMPHAKNVGHLLYDKTKDFIQNAFTVIFIASLVIWFLQTFNFHFQMVEDGRGSILAVVAGWITPLFRPMGLDRWQIVTALVNGFINKESVVATLQVLDAMPLITTLTAIPMLVFCLIYTPCVAAIAAIKRELGTRWVFFVILFQCTLAWVMAWVSYLIASAVL